jgi:hypothetical protein
MDARIYWHDLAEKALSQFKSGLLPQHVNPRNLLSRVPTIPDEPGSTCIICLDESSTKTALFLKGHSTFCVAKKYGCDVGD